MDGAQHHKLTAALSLRYGLVLALLSVLTLGGFIATQQVVEHQDGAAALLNLGGRQRMLSQRVLLLAQQLAHGPATQRERTRRELLDTVESMARNHRLLLQGDGAAGDTAPLPAPLRALYFGPAAHIDRDLDAFLAAARTLADSADDAVGDRPELHWLAGMGRDVLLPALEAAADQYQRDSETRLGDLEQRRYLVLALLLATLLFAALGVFRPMVGRLRQVLLERERAEEAIRANLEKQRVLNRITRLALEPVALDRLLQQVLDLILSRTDWGVEGSGSIFLAHPQRRELVLTVQRGLQPPLLASCARVPFGHCLCGRAADEGEIVFAGGVDQRHTIRFDGMPAHGHYCIPIRDNGATVGVLNLYLPAGHARSEQQDRFYATVADTLAGIIRRQRAAAELERHAALVRMLHGMTSAFNDALTGFEAIRACIGQMCRYTGWPVAHALLRARDDSDALLSSGIWHLPADGRFDAFRDITGTVRFRAGQGLPGQVLASARPQWSGKPFPAVDCPRAQAQRDAGIRSGFALPVLAEGEVVAVLEFFTEAELAPDEHLLRTMTDIGMQLGVVVERKRTEEEVRRNLVDQQIIAAILDISLQNLSLDEMLDRIMGLVVSGHGLGLETKGSIFLVDGAGRELVMKAQKGLADPLLEQCARLPFGKCLCGRAAASGEVVFTDGLDHRHEIGFDGMRPHGHYCVPIRDDGSVLGVLNLYVPEGHRRTAVEDNFIDTVANTLAGIIKRKQAEDRLRHLSQAVEQSPASVVITDTRGRIQYVNPKFVEVTGYAPHEVIGQSPRILKSGNVPKERYRELWSALHAGRDWRGELHNRKKNGELYWEHAAISPIKGPDGSVTHYLAVKEDITLRKDYERQLVHQATTDALTGLPNRFLALDRLAQALHHAHRPGTPVALLFIDLDHFKKINDTLGHAAGDALLAQAAERLGACVRDGDTVARMGGDEFLIILPGLRQCMDVERVALAVSERFTTPFTIEQHEIVVTASIGITVAPHDGDTPEALLRNADAAMYRAKEDGRATFHFFTRQMNEDMLAQLRTESELRHALERRELALHVQPLVRNGDARIVGAEVLLRWNSTRLGNVSPADFIPVAEDTGLIVPIGAWVLEQACAHAVRWQRHSDEPVYVAVNLSSRQFRRAGLVDTVKGALASSGLPPHLLELEVTEGILLDDCQEVRTAIDELTALGVHFSIDDFGTGYSSLSYLRRIPFHTLKIDRSFVDEIGSSEQATELVRSIIAMARNMNLAIVAEGVETRAQWDFLDREGCDISQGWYFAKAMPAKLFPHFLGDWERSTRPALGRGIAQPTSAVG